jgi:hypothetical protein
MNCFRRFLPLAAILAGIVMLAATPATARASLRIEIIDSEGGIPIVLTNPVGVSGVSVDVAYSGLSPSGNFRIQLLASSYAETAIQAELLTSTLRVERITAGTGTITFRASGNGYTLPVGERIMSSGAGGSYTPTGNPGGGTAALTFQSWFENTTPLAHGILVNDATTGLQPAVPPVSSVATTFDTGEATTVVGAGTYSLRNDTVITLSNFNTPGSPGNPGAGSILGFQGHTITTPVPAPAGLLIALSAAPMLGAGFWLRRRKTGV